MSEDNRTPSGGSLPNEITPQEAAKLRAYHLALAERHTRPGREGDSPEGDPADAGLATFILPGD
ncbi:MAG: hypothetical protein R3E50_02960 [Halioglobus sp.]